MKFLLTKDKLFFIMGLGAVISALGLVLLESNLQFLLIICVIILGARTKKSTVCCIGLACGGVLGYLYAKSISGFFDYMLTLSLFGLWAGYGLEKLRLLVQTDFLTGVYSRRSFFELLDTEMKRCDRYGQIFSLVILDLDNFKSINDRHGHLVGDRVLRGLSDLIKKRIRRYDAFGRLGGDEFGIILPNTEAKNALIIMERIQREVQGLRFAQNLETITFSIGTAEYKRGISAEELYNQVDQLLYEAKEHKNCINVSID